MRTDIHRPSAIRPEEYDFVAIIYHGPFTFELNEFERKLLNDHMNRTGGKLSQHEHGGTCHVCGAFAMNLCYFYHNPSNTYIVTGTECAEKMEFRDPALFRKFTRNREEARKNLAGKKKAEALLVERGGEELFDKIVTLFNNDFGGNTLIHFVDADQRLQWSIYTAANIVRKLIRYGNLTEKQWNFLNNLVKNIFSWEEKKAEENAKKELIPDAPEGKVVISGTILSAKVQEDFYGYSYKMLVESKDGWKVWSTVPKSLGKVEKGEQVEFTATLTRSEKDRTFAFAKRPSKAKKIS